jgi:hypothetical protein
MRCICSSATDANVRCVCSRKKNPFAISAALRLEFYFGSFAGGCSPMSLAILAPLLTEMLTAG